MNHTPTPPRKQFHVWCPEIDDSSRRIEADTACDAVKQWANRFGLAPSRIVQVKVTAPDNVTSDRVVQGMTVWAERDSVLHRV